VASPTISKESLAALVAKMREKRAAQQIPETSELEIINEPAKTSVSAAVETILNPAETEKESAAQILDKYGNPITLNSKQLEFVNLAGSGKSCVLIGAAGTGKTTCQKAVVQNLVQSGKAGILETGGHKHLSSGTPGIVICAYTRRAVANIRRNMPADLQNNCITIHKLLEYQPIYYEIDDPVSGKTRNTMKFEATRNHLNPLPSSIHTLIFEESSMLGTDLYQEVINACRHNVQLIFLGDIQQLPPVFGPAILGFKLLELPVVELTEVYRQALESPIISLAHRILSGNKLQAAEYKDWDFPGKLKIRPWKKKISDLDALVTLGNVFKAFESEGIYNPNEDIILLPFNKSCGTIELNKFIANSLARKRNAVTFEIVAGFQKAYLSIGDKVLFDKEDAEIIDIYPNPSYSGKPAQHASPYLDYWGHNSEPAYDTDEDESDLDFILGQAASAESSEDRVNKASHKIKLRMMDTEREITVDTAGEVNAMLLGYCLTVHKSQGSEWRKVFLCLHHSHSKMISSELLYTAVTRAKEELYVICESDTFTKGIETQRVKGRTLEEKAEWFKGKQKQMEEEGVE
jgi:exodeoxyribonuclease V alpha subunit